MYTDLIHWCKFDYAKPYFKILQWFPKAPKIQLILLSLVHKAFMCWFLLVSLSISSHHLSSCICLNIPLFFFVLQNIDQRSLS